MSSNNVKQQGAGGFLSDVQGNKLRDTALARTRDVCFLECILENLYRGLICFISFLKGDGQRQRGGVQPFRHSAHTYPTYWWRKVIITPVGPATPSYTEFLWLGQRDHVTEKDHLCWNFFEFLTHDNLWWRKQYCDCFIPLTLGNLFAWKQATGSNQD